MYLQIYSSWLSTSCHFVYDLSSFSLHFQSFLSKLLASFSQFFIFVEDVFFRIVKINLSWHDNNKGDLVLSKQKFLAYNIWLFPTLTTLRLPNEQKIKICECHETYEEDKNRPREVKSFRVLCEFVWLEYYCQVEWKFEFSHFRLSFTRGNFDGAIRVLFNQTIVTCRSIIKHKNMQYVCQSSDFMDVEEKQGKKFARTYISLIGDN